MAGTRNLIAHLHDEILVEIFLKLPARSLFFLRPVCRKWLHLIESPNFIHLHINWSHFLQTDPLPISRTVISESQPITRKHVLTLLSDDETLPYEIDIPLDLISPSFASRNLRSEVHLLGPCNGLFCITDTVDVVMFNPATRQCRQLPRTTLSPQRHIFTGENSFGLFECVAFGFDSVSNDYKVVRFDFDNDPHTNNYDDDDDYLDDFDDDDHYYKVEIFCLSTDCWRELGRVVPAGKMYTSVTYNLFFEGAFHWVSGSDYEIHSILVFELYKEAFKRFELPSSYEDDDLIFVYLSVLNESLAVIVHTKFDWDWNEKFEIWVMKEYGIYESWSHIYNIANPTIDILRPLSFGKDGEVFIEDIHGELASFDFRATEMKKSLISRNRMSVLESMYAFRYKESLISLKRL